MQKTELILVVAMFAAASGAACSGSESVPGSSATEASPTDPGGDEAVPEGAAAEGSAAASSSGGGADGGVSSGASDEFGAAPTCTNGKGSTARGSSMRPGDACNSCHAFSVAGTVYPSAHETALCKGVPGGAQVVVKDAKNKTTTLTVNSVGNFYSNAIFTWPIQVTITAGAKQRAMTTQITQAMGGDCNDCHTPAGAGKPMAPGRILLPK